MGGKDPVAMRMRGSGEAGAGRGLPWGRDSVAIDDDSGVGREPWTEDLRPLKTINQRGPRADERDGSHRTCQVQFPRNPSVLWAKTVTTIAHCLPGIGLPPFRRSKVLSGL